MTSMRRREFVQKLPMVAGGLLAGASVLTTSACAGVRHLAPRGTPSRLVIAASDVVEGGVLVQRPDMEWPVFLHREEAGDHVAVLARCTHLGCQPDPVGDRLVCPCHGSEFDLLANVLQGPAERPLTRYPVAVEGSDLVVTLEGADR